MREVSPFFQLNHFNIHEIVHSLETAGAISVPLLTQDICTALCQEAITYQYIPDVKTVGMGDRTVRTEYSACEVFPADSLYATLAREFEILLHQSIDTLDTQLFSTPLQFDSKVLQRYEPGQLGITPHRDSLKAINLICLFNISGRAEFYRCDDRQGTNSIQLETTPGNVIFLKAPGFQGGSDRPFHYLTHITETRYSFGLRQRVGKSW